MGQQRFLVPGGDQFAERAATRAYVAGLEGIPCPAGCCWIPGQSAEGWDELRVERAVNESGNLYVPWCVEGYGEVMLSTASLMERSRPYCLPVELARGTLNRLRNQLADWQACGLQIPAELLHALHAASRTFGDLVTGAMPDAAGKLSEQVIRESLEIARQLAAEYSQQWLAARRHDSEPLPSLLGGCLPRRPLTAPEATFVSRAWNAAVVALPWRDMEPAPGQYKWDVSDQQVQWCHNQGLRIIGGPLLSTVPHHLPDWMEAREPNFERFQKQLHQFLRAAVDRYRGKVHVWNAAAGINVAGGLAISEEQRLRLAVTSVDEVRRADPQTPTVVVFDQPWAEYLASSDLDLSPLHFADALIRADLGLSGIGLEMNIGYWPGGTLPRDVLELSRQLDRWSLLGMPLVVFLTLPSDAAPVPAARLAVRRPCPLDPPHSPQRQRDEAARLIPLILAKPFVQGLFWSQFTDQDAVEFAHGGLFDAQGRPKPVCDAFVSLYREHFS